MRSIKSRLSFAAVIFFFSVHFVFAEVHPTHPVTIALPNAVGVMGDSISEAMLVEFSLEHPPTTKQLIKMMKRTEDSEDKTIENFRHHYAKPHHSWATGDDHTDMVQSHFERIASLKSGVQSYNFSVSGSRVVDLIPQADELLATEARDNVVIDYILILIGANDLKREKIEEVTTPMAYEAGIEAQLRKILTKNPHRSILLVGLPDIHEVFELSNNLKVMKILTKTYRCKEVRETIYGDSVIFNKNNIESYEASKMIKKMYEQANDSIALKLSAEFPQANLRSIKDYRSPAKVVKTLATDCFHPSLWGQAIISEVTWGLSFWGDLTPP